MWKFLGNLSGNEHKWHVEQQKDNLAFNSAKTPGSQFPHIKYNLVI